MVNKKLPFTKKQIEKIIREYPTPFYIYDEKGIRKNIRKLSKVFSWVPNGFRNYFALKACPNPYILNIVREEGSGVDCSSLTELIIAEKIGIRGENIMFTSNDTPDEEFKKAYELGAIINLDDITHIAFLERVVGIPETICFRYNPGPIMGGNEIIGKPEESKYGLTKEQIFEAYKIMKQKGVKTFGLHTMVVSNMLDENYLIKTAEMLFGLAAELSRKLDIKFDFINLGGGIGIPYKPSQDPVDLEFFGERVRKAYEEIIIPNNLKPKIYMECGRLITGPYGWLVTRVLHVTKKYRDYVGLDACMANLMRPAIYGAYHHITVLGKENLPSTDVYDVTGSLCENNDKFAIQRKLPKVEEGDILVIHDAGAHGHAMGSNYNGKLRSAELLKPILKSDGSIKKIRRAETPEDYLKTLDFSEFG